MKRTYLLFFLICLVVFGGSACTKQPVNHVNNMYSPMEYMSLTYDRLQGKQGDWFDSFTIGNDETVYVLNGLQEEQKQELLEFKSGELTGRKSIKADETWLTGLCGNETDLFAFDYKNHRIVRLNRAGNLTEVLYEGIEFLEIRGADSLDGKLYFMAVTRYPDEHEMDEGISLGGYLNYGEVAYEFDIEKRKLTTIEADKPILQYKSSDGRLYYYTYTNRKFYLRELNLKSLKLKTVTSMDDVQYLFSFIYEGGKFYYNSVYGDINLKDMETGFITTEFSNVPIYASRHIRYSAGNLFLIDIKGDTPGRVINVISLDKNAKASGTVKELSRFSGENLVIGASLARSIPFHINGINKDYGISASVYQYPLEEELLLVKLMAGDGDIDIYIESTDRFISRAVYEKKMYEPLSGNRAIESFVEDCFESIRDFARGTDGEVWALPLSSNIGILWYNEKLLNELRLSADDLKYWDSFLSTLEKLKSLNGEYKYYVGDSDLYPFMLKNYDVNYNNFDEKQVNYNLPIFRDFFDSLYTGWIRHSSIEAQHPLFNNKPQDMTYHKGDEYDSDRTVLNIDTLFLHLNDDRNLEGWRALPIPKLASADEKPAMTLYYAYVNPNSPKKEIAIDYLEYLARHYNDYVPNSNMYSPILKGIDKYTSIFDVESEGFMDIYSIIKNSKIYLAGTPESPNKYIDDYQNGRLDLDETIETLQRMTEMSLNE